LAKGFNLVRNFDFWQTVWFMIESSIFDRKFVFFWSKFRFFAKILIFDQNIDFWPKVYIFYYIIYIANFRTFYIHKIYTSINYDSFGDFLFNWLDIFWGFTFERFFFQVQKFFRRLKNIFSNGELHIILKRRNLEICDNCDFLLILVGYV